MATHERNDDTDEAAEQPTNDSTDGDALEQYDPRRPTQEAKSAVHERDEHECLNCGVVRNDDELLDLDHAVPRGVGGGERYKNLLSLCRRCHDAKHGEGLAPTVELESTGQMTDVEFVWFKQFVTEMIPIMAEEFGVRLEPKFDLADRGAWHWPLGDLRCLDRRLAELFDRYRSLQASRCMSPPPE